MDDVVIEINNEKSFVISKDLITIVKKSSQLPDQRHQAFRPSVSHPSNYYSIYTRILRFCNPVDHWSQKICAPFGFILGISTTASQSTKNLICYLFLQRRKSKRKNQTIQKFIFSTINQKKMCNKSVVIITTVKKNMINEIYPCIQFHSPHSNR